MADQLNAPYAPQDISEVAQLIKGLNNSTKKHGNVKNSSAQSKKTSFAMPGTSLTVDSWRFKEWDYKRRDLPTYARGLFTYRRSDNAPEIAVRGYDKFFNVGEVHDTEWKNVETRTRGPYELSVKENGCIIFLAGLEGDHLLVCSKHSTGARSDTDLSHAQAGERWVEKHLATVGKTKTDLARELRRRNVTAVAELCDDEFEEHVLAYDEKDAGLYLHGVNLNLPEFATYPGPLVHRFADEWGFRKADFLVKDDLESMQKFLEKCAETGSYDGRDTEGFVIRCQKKAGSGDSAYVDWFFKYKFEEPYLMYRQWREATKQLISGKAPQYRKHKAITDEYLLYARRQLAKDKSLAKAYNLNHGIIAMREGFLKEQGLKGSDIVRQEHGDAPETDVVTHNLVLLPIASIGCGKTTVALALKHLFDWGHIQNDNITGKTNRPKQFCLQLCNSLSEYPVTIGDRNNHQKRERKQIMEDMLQVIPDTRFVALHYVHDPKPDMLPRIRQITQERIFARGDNHQTIQAGSKSRQEITGIMEGFLQRFEPVNQYSEPDNGFDEIIDLDVSMDSRANLETVILALHTKYPRLVPTIPTPEEMDEAIDAAQNDYKPNVKHDLSFGSKKKNHQPPKSSANHAQQNGQTSILKPPKLEFFCVSLPAQKVNATIEQIFNHLRPERAKTYRMLQQSRRIQPGFHVTLMHRASIPSNPDLWYSLTARHSQAMIESAAQNNGQANFDPELGRCRVRLERVIWDERLMCVVTRLLDEGWQSVNPITHVTVGTINPNVKPKESNDLLAKWMQVGATGGIMEERVEGSGDLEGVVRAVMQR